MPSDGADNTRSPSTDDGFTVVGKGGKPKSAGKGSQAGQVDGTAGAAPADAGVASGLGSPTSTNAGGSPSGAGGGKKPSPKPRSKSPTREREADRHAELLAAIVGLGAHRRAGRHGGRRLVEIGE